MIFAIVIWLFFGDGKFQDWKTKVSGVFVMALFEALQIGLWWLLFRD
jgi:hypothetical protein